MFLKNHYCYVYIVECSDKTLYTGITWNLRKRIMQHNGLVWGTAKYTRGRRPVFFVHIERFNSRSEAAKREFEIKKFSANQKRELIKNTTKDQILSAI